MAKVKTTLGFITTLAICHVTFSQILLIQRFYLQVTCSGNGFNAKAEKMCINYDSRRECFPSESDGDDSSGDEDEDLLEQLVQTMTREYCQGKENTTIPKLNITRTFIKGDIPAPIEDDASTGTVSKILSLDEDDQEKTIQSLKVGVALGTIFGFLFGVFVTGLGAVLMKYKQRISSQKIKLMETASDNVQPDEKNHNADTYEYCDVEDGNYQLPREGTCMESNNSSVSHNYDCNHTYNHLNENNEINLNAKYYDHFRGASGDEQPTNGEYRVLESQRRASGDEQPTSGEQPTNGEYKVLESRRGTRRDEQPTDGEYKVLESRRGASGDEQPTNGEYRVLELQHPQVNSSGEPGKLPSKNKSHENESNYFQTETESIQNPKKDAYFVLEKNLP